MTTTQPASDLVADFREAIARLVAERDAIDLNEPGKRKANAERYAEKVRQIDQWLERYNRFLQGREFDRIVTGSE